MSLLKKANAAFRSKEYRESMMFYEEVIKKEPFLEQYIISNLEIVRRKIENERVIWNKEPDSGNEKYIQPESELLINARTPSDFIICNPQKLDCLYKDKPIICNKEIKHNELVSVIIPSYNNGEYIARAINSVLSQIGVNVEVLVVDDGSIDNSVATAIEISKKYNNVNVFSLLRNFGCYYARNYGLLHAKGIYVSVVDSDDIVAPDFLLHSINTLKANPNLKACRSNQRRWVIDYSQAISKLKAGENSIVWKRELIKDIGWYDGVRFGGDSEFRYRIQRYTGNNLPLINKELYFARTLRSSLTTSNSGAIFQMKGDELEYKPNSIRVSYFNNYTEWQKKSKPSIENPKSNLFISFPQIVRSFEITSREQNASPSLGQKRFGALASYPPREDSLRETVKSILPQIDYLYIYLNNYEYVPKFLLYNEKIKIFRSQEAEGDLRDNGKFFSIPNEESCYVFTFDDDIIYPEDYVARMIHNIEMLGRTCVVGVHGVIFPQHEFKKLQQRQVFHFKEDSAGHFVDLLGTGTTAWHTATIKVNLQDFLTKGVCDLWFAKLSAKRKVPLFSVRRNKNWIKPSSYSGDSLYKEALKDPDMYFNIYNEHLKPFLEGGRIRRSMEVHLNYGFGDKILTAAGICLLEKQPEINKISTSLCKPLTLIRQPELLNNLSSKDDFHFHIIVNGWNCSNYIDSCLQSIVNQQPGSYTYEVTLIDDGSDDGTFEKLASISILPYVKLVRVEKNTGPAYARHIGIIPIINPETIVVTLDMDDALELNALKIVSNKYRENPKCLVTIGNWHDQYGKINPQVFYTDNEIDEQKIREVELFNATHLRTFKRKLYNAVTPADLLDHEGEWLETCTDVALMYPLLDQCWSNEVEFINEPIYKYTRKHSSGTLSRFGKPHKVKRLNWLKSKEKKPRFNSTKS